MPRWCSRPVSSIGYCWRNPLAGWVTTPSPPASRPGTFREAPQIPEEPMSLKLTPVGPIPELTAYVAHAAFPDGNTYTTLRDRLGTFYDAERCAERFPPRGQPAEAPWRLALVTVMQFAEGLPDRQAAEA